MDIVQRTQQTWRIRDAYCINVYKIGSSCRVHNKFTTLLRSDAAAGVTAVLIMCTHYTGGCTWRI